jgi:hypothetical protein
MISWGLVFLLIIIAAPFMDDPNFMKTIMGSLIIGGIPFALGILLLRNTNKKEKEYLQVKYENDLLKLAESKNGLVTESITAVALNISLANSRKLLYEMCHKGYAYSDVNENGVIEYYFKSYMK